MEILAEQSFETFRQLFPLIRVQADEDALRYTISDADRASFYEQEACRIIASNCLPLEVNILTWSSEHRGCFETVLEVKMVKEEEFTACY